MNPSSTSPQPVRTYLAHPSRPTLKLPAHAADCHVHVFGPTSRFPYAQGLQVVPLEAPKESLFALHASMGIERCVIVQSMTHGTDNRVVEDAIAAGGGRYLGIALVEPTVSDQALQRLAQAGFRGVRFNFMQHLGDSAKVDEILKLTPRLAAVGMHLQVHFESKRIHALAPELQKSAVPVVIDHMGRIDATLGIEHADFKALCQLLEHPKFHVKLSGIDRIDAHAPPPQKYQHGILIAKTLLQRFPDRCVWGSDWPHPNHTHIPDDGVLVDALNQIAPSQALLTQLLVTNPQTLYRF